MKIPRLIAAIGLIAGLAFATTALASHADLIGDVTFKTGPEVTKKCIECHEQETHDFMKTVHWTWSKKQKQKKGTTVEFGKINALNNFCIGLPGNWPRCTSCHAGYGWKDASFDFKKAENVDCLVCHDTTGTYKKFPTGAGHPAYEGEAKEWPKGKPWPSVDLKTVAHNVGPTSRATCGACHFYGGGGDHVKHGDLDTSMIDPGPEIDIHMGGRKKMTCSECHETKDHFLKGESGSVSLSHEHGRHIDCTDCHKDPVHKNALVNKHTKRVACQSCHITTYAKALPTKVWWDWSTAGKDVKPEDVPKDQFGMKLYDKMKGDFKWDKNVEPEYMWFNGNINRYLAGQKIDPAKVVRLSYPDGNRNDPKAKIYPFKIMSGKQAYDAGNNTIAFMQVFGPPGSDAYWQKYDFNLAIAAGMKAAGQPYSGKYGWIETMMAWPLHHMVVSADRSVKCQHCHGGKSRLDWKKLGYPGDPIETKNRGK